ncbi:MAG: ribonuclease H-like domain-containing protein [Haloferacaceae archaeon]
MRIENSFIPVRGVGEKTERRLWRAGVTRWEAFEPSVPGVGETTADRIESFIREASTRLQRRDAAYFDRRFPSGQRWRLYENFRDSTCFFDIETTGLDERRDGVTTVSFHRDGETTTLVRGQDLTADRLRREFEAADLLASFNGARFDVPFLEASFDLEVTTPHLDLMYPCKKLGLSGGLKPIERELGIRRELPDVDGREAVRLWRRYEGGDEDALDRLIAYNREDAVNLRRLADRVTGDLHDRVFVDGATTERGGSRS